MVEDVWDCYGTRSEPLPSLEWWKTSETATALGRNYYQVWKMSGTATALGWNHYPIWNGGRCLRLLRHSVGTTTKYGLVEDVRDCYGTRLEPLPSVEDVWDCYGTRSEPLPGMEWWKTSETATALGRNHYQTR